MELVGIFGIMFISMLYSSCVASFWFVYIRSQSLTTYFFKFVFKNDIKWFGSVCVALAMFFLFATLYYCFSLALTNEHVRISNFPPISMIGVDFPEHYWFVVGFATVSLFLTLSVCTYASLCFHANPEHKKSIIFLLCIGISVHPFLFLMAVLDLDYFMVAHFVAAILAITLLLVFQLFHIYIDFKIFNRAKILYGYYTSTTMLGIGGIIGWLSGCMICQWIGVGAMFLHFIPWLGILSTRPEGFNINDRETYDFDIQEEEEEEEQEEGEYYNEGL